MYRNPENSIFNKKMEETELSSLAVQIQMNKTWPLLLQGCVKVILKFI